MVDLLTRIRRENGLSGHDFAEPFAGGAGAALTLLFLEESRRIYINDADRSISDLWWALTNRSGPFLRMLSEKRVNISEWRRQRDVYKKPSSSRLNRAFATFYLNRCNRSGIILNGGPIGGIKQDGQWKIGARYNKKQLKERCGRIAEYSDRIRTSSEDGLEFIKKLERENVFFFIDPPYFEKGPTLYLNSLSEDYHQSLAEELRRLEQRAWVLTYDDCTEIRKMYRGWANIRPFALPYAAAERRTGREVLITPRWLKLPTHQRSDALVW